jgi:hypothetical protein
MQKEFVKRLQKFPRRMIVADCAQNGHGAISPMSTSAFTIKLSLVNIDYDLVAK